MRRIIMLTLLAVMSSLTVIGKNVLDLTKAPIIKIGINSTINAKKNGDIWSFQIKDNKPISIDSIVFAKNSTKSESAEIFIDGKSFKKWSRTKDAETITFQIKNKSIVNIIWGDQIWTLKLKDKELPPGKGKDTSGNKTNNKSVVWLVGGICFVMGLVVCFFSLGIYRRIRKKTATKKESPTDINGNDETKIENALEDNDKGKPDDAQNAEALVGGQVNTGSEYMNNLENDEDDTDLEKKLDDQIANIINGYEEDFFKECVDLNAKIGRLQEILKDYFNLLDAKKKLAEILGKSEKAEIKLLLNEVKDIKSKLIKENEQEVHNSPKTFDVAELERLINKNEKIKDVYNKLTKGSMSDILRQLFEKLNRKIEKSIDITSIDDKLKAKNYVVDQLGMNGFNEILAQIGLKKIDDYFVANTTLESGLSKIKEDITKENQGKTASGGQIVGEASSHSGFNAFVKELEKQLPNLPNGIDSVEELTKAIKDLLEHQNVGNTADNDNSSTSIDAESSVIENFLKEVGMTSDGNKAHAIAQIKEAFGKVNDLDSICKQYGADNIKELCSAIKEKIYKSVKGGLSANEAVKTIITNCHTTEGITKTLSDAYISLNSEKQKIEKERNGVAEHLKESYTKEIDVKEQDMNVDDLEVMFDSYEKAVLEKIESEKKTVSSLQDEISEKQTIIDANNEKFGSMLLDMKKKQESDFDEMQKSIKATFIRPCDQNLKSQCDLNQSLLYDAFKKFSKQLQGVEQVDDYEKFFKDVQDIIEKDIVDEHGLTNVLARYYAYSCLPFMTDNSREYGMRIDHKLMMRAFHAYNHFVSQYGLQLIVPNLFADRIDDGEYQDCTGEKYGDLENMCPGVANYVLEISNSDKQHYITDLVQVGYKKDKEVKVKAKVIITD